MASIGFFELLLIAAILSVLIGVPIVVMFAIVRRANSDEDQR